MYERGGIWGPASKMKKCRSQTTCHQRHDARPGFFNIIIIFNILPRIAMNFQNKFSISSCKIWVIFYFVAF